MTNRFDNNGGGDQNVGQGEGAIGKQTNIFLQPLKPRVLILVALLAAVVFGAVLAGWRRGAPKGEETRISTTGGNAPVTVAGRDVTVNNNGIPSKVIAEQVAKSAEELGATKQLISTFLGTLLEQKVPRDQWDRKLCEIAATYKELQARLATVQSEDPEVRRLKKKAGQAIKEGEYARAEDLLNRAEAHDLAAIEELEQTAKQRRIFAAATNAELAKLQRVQLRYAKAAEYWQKAAALLPEGEKKNRAYYLNAAGYDLWHTARYSEALPLYEQSLAILREIGDRAGEGTILSNIGVIHYNQNDYNKALSLYDQSLSIKREVGSGSEEGTTLNNIIWIYHHVQGKCRKLLMFLNNTNTSEEITPFLAGLISSPTSDLTLENILTISREINAKSEEETLLNNISQIYKAQGDYTMALNYLKQSLAIRRELGKKAKEGTTLNDLAITACAKGDINTALSYLEQSLVIRQEISDRNGEAMTSWDIGMIYKDQGDLRKAEQYISRAVQIAEEIGDSSSEGWRKDLEKLRVEIKSQ